LKKKNNIIIIIQKPVQHDDGVVGEGHEQIMYNKVRAYFTIVQW